MPSRRSVGSVPVCADSTALHTSSSVSRVPIAPPLAVRLSQTLQ